MIHIAIMRQPFYDMVLSGEKTIESRWSKNKIAPYKKINSGDTILFKLTGKPATAMAKVEKVEFYELTPQIAEEIKLQYGMQIGTDKFEDLNKYANKNYCTLIWLTQVKQIESTNVPKSHGAGWIIL